MAEFVVPLRKEIEDSLTRQSVQNTSGLHRVGLLERQERNEFAFERARKQVLTVKNIVHLILHSSTRALVAVSISNCKMKGSTARVCACKQNLLTFLIICLRRSRRE